MEDNSEDSRRAKINEIEAAIQLVNLRLTSLRSKYGDSVYFHLNERYIADANGMYIGVSIDLSKLDEKGNK